MVQKFVLLTTMPSNIEMTNVAHKKKERLSANDSKTMMLPVVDA